MHTTGSTRTRTKSSAKVPDFDALAVGRVGIRVHIEALELVSAEFTSIDVNPLSNDRPNQLPQGSGIKVEWSSSAERRRLGCVITFGTVFEDEATKPYNLVASYRVTYTIRDNEPLPIDGDIENFMHWNAVFNAWPYWREYLASTMNRAGLPRFVIPIARMPIPGMTTAD